MKHKLKKDFYTRNVHIVAKELLGKILVSEDSVSKTKLLGKIVEVEAYDGKIDEAAHTFVGKTERNRIMFSDGGYLYVYFIYGKHFCCNVVTGIENEGTAILLRALEPIEGFDIFAERRFNKLIYSEKEKINMLNGPAKICQAFNINRSNNGTSLVEDTIYLLDSARIENRNIITTTRVGINKSKHLPWRYFIKDNQFVSKL